MEQVISALTATDEQKATILEMISLVPTNAREKWFENLAIENGLVLGTYGGDVADILTFNQFRKLYEALGYDFAKFGTWYDRERINWPPVQCHFKPNWTCRNP